MNGEIFTYPVASLEEQLGGLPHANVLHEYQGWWEERGLAAPLVFYLLHLAGVK